jgi:hypothetical protein
MDTQRDAHRADDPGPRSGGAAPDGRARPEGRFADDEHAPDAFDNPVERLKLLSGDDEQLARYLDALEVTSPRERELLWEISRTRPLADSERFPARHRNMVEALESLARHGYRGARVGARLGPLRVVARWGVELVARYVVVSHVRNVSTTLRNLYGLREIEAVPGTPERRELRRARMDAERMVEALKARELGLPTFLIGGALLPLAAAFGRLTGVLGDTRWATVLGVLGMLLALAASWCILRGAATASRRIRLALRAPEQALWGAIGWCGTPPKSQTRTFVIVAVTLTLGAWIIVPVLVGIAIAT